MPPGRRGIRTLEHHSKSQRRYPPPSAALGAGAALTPAPKAKGPVAVRTPLADGVRGPSLWGAARPAHGLRRTLAVGFP